VTRKIVLENLKHRPMRSLLSIVLIAVPVTLILALVGLTNGMLEDSQNRQRGAGADIVVRGTGATSVVSFSAATISKAFVNLIEQQPHVKLAMGVNTHNLDLPLVITGVDPVLFKEMTGGFVFDAGRDLRDPDDMVIDNLYAAQRHLKVGDAVTLMGHKWHIVGIAESGKIARIAVRVDRLQELDSATNKFSQIYVKLDDPKYTYPVKDQLQKLLGDLNVYAMPDFIAMFSAGKIPGVKPFTIVVVSLGIIIGFLVVYLSMYMAVLQRTREIGILKSLGASKGFILGIIETEALVLGVAGTILGILLSYGAYWLIHTLVPASIPMIIVKTWWPIAGGVTLGAAGLGALYPGLNAARQDPIEALAYE
jgi:putative ABC transport system permease protein